MEKERDTLSEIIKNLGKEVKDIKRQEKLELTEEEKTVLADKKEEIEKDLKNALGLYIKFVIKEIEKLKQKRDLLKEMIKEKKQEIESKKAELAGMDEKDPNREKLQTELAGMELALSDHEKTLEKAKKAITSYQTKIRTYKKKYAEYIVQEPVTEPTAGTVTEPTAGTVAEPTAGTVAEPTAGPVTEPTAGTVTEPTAGPVTEQPEPTAGPVTEQPEPIVEKPDINTRIAMIQAQIEETNKNAWEPGIDASERNDYLQEVNELERELADLQKEVSDKYPAKTFEQIIEETCKGKISGIARLFKNMRNLKSRYIVTLPFKGIGYMGDLLAGGNRHSEKMKESIASLSREDFEILAKGLEKNSSLVDPVYVEAVKSRIKEEKIDKVDETAVKKTLISDMKKLIKSREEVGKYTEINNKGEKAKSDKEI